MIGTSAGRVPSNTSFDVNQRINDAFHGSMAYYAGHPTEIPARLAELDREWDVERALATASACFSLAGLALGFSGRRRAFVLPAVVQTFYLQHAIQGWCPPLPVLRHLGFRTSSEIDREKCALKDLLREDNAQLTGAPASRTGTSATPDENAEAIAVIYEEFSIR